MPPPKVSVCIDVYNYADFLARAIESVLDQTFPDFELIVVDDRSTDDSYEVALSYAKRDNRMRVERNAANLGMVKNRNACLRLAQGEYVKFVHADDYMYSSETVSKMAACIEANPEAVLVACGMQFVKEDGSVNGRSPDRFSAGRFFPGASVITRCLGEQKNLIGGPSATLFRRSCAQRGFDERYFHAADLEMWFHLLEQGCFGYVGEPLVAYRWHARQQTEKDRNTLSQANDQRAMHASYLDRPYVHLRPWQKEFVVHDAVRQTVRRCAKIGAKETAAAVVREYGARRYYANYPWCLLWRKLSKFSRSFGGLNQGAKR